MSTDTPTPERVTLTNEERGHAYEHFDDEGVHVGRCYIEADVETILAAREQALREEIAGEIEAQRDEFLYGEGRWTLFDYAARIARGGAR